MNKLVASALAIAVGASVTQAATLSWRQNTTPFTKDSSALAGSKVLLILSDSAAPTLGWENDALTISGTYLGQSALANSGVLSTVAINIDGDWSSGNVEVAGGAAYGKPATVDAADIGYGTNNKHDYYMAIFDSDSISSSSKYTLVELAQKNVGSKTGTLTLAFQGADLSNATWTNVPEPTTVALLALGLAAVGLKRKVA